MTLAGLALAALLFGLNASATPEGAPGLHGPTTVLQLSNGRRVYVGRAGVYPWLQLPSLEVNLTSEEAREIGSALALAAIDAEVFRETTLDVIESRE
jgi:hypothetical protein